MKIILVLLALSVTLMAVELSVQQQNIRKMIKAIQEASDAERFEKMNAFKKLLRAMNAKQRQEAILKLQSSLQTKNRLAKGEEKQERVRTQTQLQESQQQLQLQHQMQNQNQLQQNGLGGKTMKKP